METQEYALGHGRGQAPGTLTLGHKRACVRTQASGDALGGWVLCQGAGGRARHQGTKDTVVALPPLEVGAGRGRGRDRDMGGPQRPRHGSPDVALYLQGFGDSVIMNVAVGPLFSRTGQSQGTHV